MAAREELVRDLVYTERLLEYEGYNHELRRKLLDEKCRLESALLDANATDPEKQASENA